jgi:hypothetical protein
LFSNTHSLYSSLNVRDEVYVFRQQVRGQKVLDLMVASKEDSGKNVNCPIVKGDVSRKVRTSGNNGINAVMWDWIVDKGLLEFQEQLYEVARLTLQLQ